MWPHLPAFSATVHSYLVAAYKLMSNLLSSFAVIEKRVFWLKILNADLLLFMMMMNE